MEDATHTAKSVEHARTATHHVAPRLGLLRTPFLSRRSREPARGGRTVYAGRRLHAEIAREEDDGERLTLSLESERWGLVGKVDCVRRRDGMLIPYEHKRGRSAQSSGGRRRSVAQ